MSTVLAALLEHCCNCKVLLALPTFSRDWRTVVVQVDQEGWPTGSYEGQEEEEAGPFSHQGQNRETKRTQRERHDQETVAADEKCEEAGQASH